ncbi:UNKNOWN [Stylonychia lemnae]|uniref:Uncharacterized protein n=1 Tax=Stylonychia lemnae TaxID=5949 RepID=A0A077ZZS1_STYLE|nr:UNKNOWN [Stylonychia lemnae]|eukprot:CDW75390.1 UNKNOWN [Stylonychia lemnae]
MPQNNKIPQKSSLDVRQKLKKKPLIQEPYFNQIKPQLEPLFDSLFIAKEVFEMFYDDIDNTIREKNLYKQLPDQVIDQSYAVILSIVGKKLSFQDKNDYYYYNYEDESIEPKKIPVNIIKIKSIKKVSNFDNSLLSPKNKLQQIKDELRNSRNSSKLEQILVKQQALTDYIKKEKSEEEQAIENLRKQIELKNAEPQVKEKQEKKRLFQITRNENVTSDYKGKLIKIQKIDYENDYSFSFNDQDKQQQSRDSRLSQIDLLPKFKTPRNETVRRFRHESGLKLKMPQNLRTSRSNLSNYSHQLDNAKLDKNNIKIFQQNFNNLEQLLNESIKKQEESGKNFVTNLSGQDNNSNMIVGTPKVLKDNSSMKIQFSRKQFQEFSGKLNISNVNERDSSPNYHQNINALANNKSYLFLNDTSYMMEDTRLNQTFDSIDPSLRSILETRNSKFRLPSIKQFNQNALNLLLDQEQDKSKLKISRNESNQIKYNSNLKQNQSSLMSPLNVKLAIMDNRIKMMKNKSSARVRALSNLKDNSRNLSIQYELSSIKGGLGDETRSRNQLFSYVSNADSHKAFEISQNYEFKSIRNKSHNKL